jgi:hypothetical protein
MRFAFEFDTGPGGRAWLRLFGVKPGNAWVDVDDGGFAAHCGRWHVTSALANVTEVHVAGPYREIKAIGIRLSLRDHGLTFGTTAKRGVCIHFREPLKSITIPPYRHPNLTVTVERPEEFVEVLRAGAGLPDQAEAEA